MLRLAAILTCVALNGCGVAPARDSQSVDAGAEVTLAPGEAVAVKTADLRVRFIAVAEDSRCPRDVTCVWAGEVRIQLEIQRATQPAARVEMSEGGSTLAGDFRVSIVRVEPQPMSTERIAPQGYRATLKVEKAG
jgi:hypothetical protein